MSLPERDRQTVRKLSACCASPMGLIEVIEAP